MDERKHPPSFQFYPADFLSSTAVALMSHEARGGYITLLCHAWLQPEPGILDDDDAALASLSGLAERWSACSVAIRRAFRATSREGRKVLVQSRMVQERVEQERRFQQASKGARVTNEKRWGKVAQRHDSDGEASRSAVTPSSSSSLKDSARPSASRGSEDSTSPLKGAVSELDLAPTNGHDPANLTLAQWFDRVFWKRYPRKVGKKVAWKVVQKLFKPLQSEAEKDALGDAIIDLLKDRVKGEWYGRDADKIPHASTFLNAEEFSCERS